MVPRSIALGPQLPRGCAQLDSLCLCSLLGSPGSLRCHDVEALNSCTAAPGNLLGSGIGFQQAHACQAADRTVFRQTT